jgi:hypothetical protein
LQQGIDVLFAGNEWERKYATASIPGLPTIHLDGYDVWYSKTGIGFIPSLFRQLPRLLQTINREHNQLKKIVAEQHIDAVITDNRYGLYHPNIPSVIMTHQVVPQTGWGPVADKTLQWLHAERLNRFDHCWIVDVEGEPNLAGRLSHPKHKAANAQYIGLLSQLTTLQATEEHLLVLLSGPEPQRTMLSDILWMQLQNIARKIVFVEGSDQTKRNDIPPHIDYYQRLTAAELNPILAAAETVICRSGYSTLMDLVLFGKKAIIIPTPGQAEQEYLARHLHREGVWLHAPQKRLNIEATLQEARNFPFRKLLLNEGFDQYKTVIDNWLTIL